MTPADTNRATTVWPLAGLFDALRQESFQLRPDDYLEVVRVLDAFQPTSAADLQALIAPLIVTSDEEQAKFDRIFQTIQRKNELQPLVRTARKRRLTRWVMLATALLTALVLAYVAFIWPGPVFKTEVSDVCSWAIGVIAILLQVALGFYFWLMRRNAQKKKALDRPAPVAETSESASSSDSENPLAEFVSDEPPLEIPLENREAELITRDQQLYQVVRTLRQPAESENWRLHIPHTMQATMREGGFPTLVFQPHLSETEYLFLIDRSKVHSQQVALFEYLFGAFVRESVCADRFFFHRTFDSFTNENHSKGLTIRQLANTYRSRTLIIWGDGYPLLYPPYPVVEPAIRDALTDWEMRAILTPIPFANWGSKERALQGHFLLLPADLTGQLRLIQALTEKQPNQDAYLERSGHSLYPTDSVNFRDVSELCDYLGDALFQWLAAIAVYPRIRWEVVVEMGRALLPPEAVNFTNLLKLVRISWMHDGSFPDRTRFELLKELRPENEVKARQMLLQMIAYSERYFPGDHFFDGEKYILRTVNQFTLYAHNPTAFARYQPAEQTFRTLYDKGLYPDGPTLRYLENPAQSWVTLLPVRTAISKKAGKSTKPSSISLWDYFNEPSTETREETPEINQPVDEEPIKPDNGLAYPLDSTVPYNPKFIGKQTITLPIITASNQLSGEVFDYIHYSLVMYEPRAMLLYVAYNIDRTTMSSLPRGDRGWLLDPRIPKSLQTGDELYRGSEWDRGSMVPHRAVMWGDSSVAARAAQSTFYFSNTVPQHQLFNRGNWAKLEDFVLEKLRPEAKRLSVFAGPVYRQTDIAYRGRLIPRSFWMIAVVSDESNPQNFFVHAYLMDQYTLDPDGSFEPVPKVGKFNPNEYQDNVSEIEAITLLRFGSLSDTYKANSSFNK